MSISKKTVILKERRKVLYDSVPKKRMGHLALSLVIACHYNTVLIIIQLLLFFLTKKIWYYLCNVLTDLETNLALDFVREGMVDSLIKLQQDLQGKLGTNLL